MSPEILRDVNAARRALRLSLLKEMPQGRSGDACYCPLANAMGGVGEVFRFYFRLYDELAGAEPELIAAEIAAAWGTKRTGRRGLEIALPSALIGFVSDFDKGKYPDLEEPHVEVA